MLFPLEPGVGWQVCPLLSAGRPGAAPGCISASTSCSALLLSNFSPTKMREVFKCSSEVQRRLREGVQRERGWRGGGTGGCQGARACIILPPPP